MINMDEYVCTAVHYYAEPLGFGRGILRCDVVVDGELMMSYPVGSPAPFAIVLAAERTVPLDKQGGQSC